MVVNNTIAAKTSLVFSSTGIEPHGKRFKNASLKVQLFAADKTVKHLDLEDAVLTALVKMRTVKFKRKEKPLKFKKNVKTSILKASVPVDLDLPAQDEVVNVEDEVVNVNEVIAMIEVNALIELTDDLIKTVINALDELINHELKEAMTVSQLVMQKTLLLAIKFHCPFPSKFCFQKQTLIIKFRS